MYIKNIWRYPVKTMAGEELQSINVNPDGIDGDRKIHVADGRGGVLTSRTHPQFLRHLARIDASGAVLVDDQPWQSATVDAAVKIIGGKSAALRRYEGVERFDVLPLLVATDGAISAFGRDYRRLRPNLVIGGVEGMDETRWPGKKLRIGEVVIGIQDLRGRCIMTSYDPDTQVQDKSITRDIYARFNGVLALNCWVISAGPIKLGDPVEVF